MRVLGLSSWPTPRAASRHALLPQRKQAQQEERIARMREQARQLSAAELAAHTRRVTIWRGSSFALEGMPPCSPAEPGRQLVAWMRQERGWCGMGALGWGEGGGGARRLSGAPLLAHCMVLPHRSLPGMHCRAMDAKLAELEAGRDLTRTWLHVDMDAFFAAVEELDQPHLVGLLICRKCSFD